MPTEPSVSRDRVFRFGSFELSQREGELRRSGVRIKLQEQPFRVLVELVANAGKLVSREDLHQKLWPSDTFVDFDVGLNSAIRKLRQALNDDADHPHYIETLAKRGYRFVAPVADSAAAAQTTSKDLPPGAVSLSGDGTNSSTGEEAQRKPRRWYWALAACVLALLIYGGFAAWRWTNRTRPLGTEQRITANPPEAPITGAVVSPDGKYVAYSDTTGVYIRHIDSGETRPLELPKGFDAVPTSWFPDSAHLLLSVVEGGGTTPSLWKVSIFGASLQKVMEDVSEGVVSPDGSKIALLRNAFDARVYLSYFAGYAREIWLVDTGGSNLRRLIGAEAPQNSGKEASEIANRRDSKAAFYHLAWSPDGRRIAYFRVVDLYSSTPRSALETLETNGNPAKVVESPGEFRWALTWAANDRVLYASRNDPGSERTDYGIWSVRVNAKTGEPLGKPTQLTKGVGRIGGLSVTTDSKRLIMWRTNTFPEVFLTEINRETGRLNSPRRLTLDENRNVVNAWTPDSRAVLFLSNRNGTYKLFRQSIDQTTPEVLIEGSSIRLLRLNADGTRILYLAEPNPKDPAHLVSVVEVSLEGGSPRLILQKPFILNIKCARSPSKLCILYAVQGSTTHFFSFDPESGQTQEFASVPVSEVHCDLSPDGTQLAFFLPGPERKVTFMRMADQSTRDVMLNEWPRLNQITWDSEGKSLFVTSQTVNGTPVVLRVEPGGQHRVLLQGDKSMRFWWVEPSPDGRYAALEAITGENNVWMVENF